MAIKFRRTLKIAPGIRLNLGSKSASVRVGGRGYGITKGTSGTTVSAGLPGSGLHVSKKLKANTRDATALPEMSGATSTSKKIGIVGRVTLMIALAIFVFAGWAIYVGMAAPT